MFLWLQMFEGYFANVGEDWAGKHKKTWFSMVFFGIFQIHTGTGMVPEDP